MFLKSSPLLRILFHNQLWKVKTKEKKVYLTFDDGPVPEITEWVLDVLRAENIKATFFCIGDNIRKHPLIFKKIMADDHVIGNHTFHHVKGWGCSASAYFQDVEDCRREIEKHQKTKSQLFRPPYGKITPVQTAGLLKRGYRIVMWDIVSKDYDQQFGADKSLQMITENVSKGSIIVFHDSAKAYDTLQQLLPKCIKVLKTRGYTFDVLN